MKKISDNLNWNDFEKIENLGIQFMTIGHRGTKVNFTSLLEEQNYIKTLAMAKIPSNWIYKKEIKDMYSYNSEGFRNDFEFDDVNWKKSIAVLGCSNVFSKAVEQKHGLCNYIQEETGLTAVNLGVEGASIRTTFNNAIHLLDRYNPKQLAIFWPNNNRINLAYKWDLNQSNWSHIDMTGTEGKVTVHENLEPNSLGIIHSRPIQVGFKDLWPRIDESYFIENQDTIYQQNLYKQVLKLIARDRNMPLFEYSLARIQKPKMSALDQVDAEYPDQYRQNFNYMGDYENRKKGWIYLSDDQKQWWLNFVCARDIGSFEDNGGPKDCHFGPVLNKAIAKLILKNRLV